MPCKWHNLANPAKYANVIRKWYYAAFSNKAEFTFFDAILADFLVCPYVSEWMLVCIYVRPLNMTTRLSAYRSDRRSGLMLRIDSWIINKYWIYIFQIIYNMLSTKFIIHFLPLSLFFRKINLWILYIHIFMNKIYADLKTILYFRAYLSMKSMQNADKCKTGLFQKKTKQTKMVL